MLVIDASVLAVALLDAGPDGDAARNRLHGEQLTAPALIDLEVVSVWRGLAHLDPRRVGFALDDLRDLPIQRVAHAPLLARCWELRDRPREPNPHPPCRGRTVGERLGRRHLGHDARERVHTQRFTRLGHRHIQRQCASDRLLLDRNDHRAGRHVRCDLDRTQSRPPRPEPQSADGRDDHGDRHAPAEAALGTSSTFAQGGVRCLCTLPAVRDVPAEASRSVGNTEPTSISSGRPGGRGLAARGDTL